MTLPALAAFTESLATVRRALDAAAGSVEALERWSAAIEALGNAPERERYIGPYNAALGALERRLSYDGPVIAATNETLRLVDAAEAAVKAEIEGRHHEAARKEAARREAEGAPQGRGSGSATRSPKPTPRRRRWQARSPRSRPRLRQRPRRRTGWRPEAMTESVCLVMPAASLTAPTPSPAGRRGGERRGDDMFRARDDRRERVRAWIATAEARLRKIEGQRRRQAPAPGLASNDAIVARARALMAEAGSGLNAIEAVHRARAEAGVGGPAALAGALDAVKAESGKLDAGIAAAMEAQLLEWARKAIAAARRKLEDGLPLDAGEGALDAREALFAIEELRAGKPHFAKRLLHERVSPPRA